MERDKNLYSLLYEFPVASSAGNAIFLGQKMKNVKVVKTSEPKCAAL